VDHPYGDIPLAPDTSEPGVLPWQSDRADDGGPRDRCVANAIARRDAAGRRKGSCRRCSPKVEIGANGEVGADDSGRFLFAQWAIHLAQVAQCAAPVTRGIGNVGGDHGPSPRAAPHSGLRGLVGRPATPRASCMARPSTDTSGT